MSKIFFLSLLLIPVVLTACTPKAPQTETKQEQNNSTSSNSNPVELFKNAITLGQSLKCTYKDTEGEATTVVKGKKMRIDGISYGKDNTSKGTMINDGEWVYVWSSDQNVGLKYKLSDLQTLNDPNATGEQTEEWSNPEKWADEMNTKQDVKCAPELVTDAQFQVPSNVTFEDMGDALKAAKQYMGTKPSDLNNLPANIQDVDDVPLPDDTVDGE